MGVGELTTHAERLISSPSELDVGVSYSYPSLYQKFMAKGRLSCTIPWREDVFCSQKCFDSSGCLTESLLWYARGPENL